MAILDFVLAAVLLVWGARQIRDGARAAAVPCTQRLLSRVLRGREFALVPGFVSGLLSTAERNDMQRVCAGSAASTRPPAGELRFMLGAHLGAGAAMLLLVAAPAWCFHAFLMAGLVSTLCRSHAAMRDTGRALLGAGMTLFALRLLELGAPELLAAPFFAWTGEELRQDGLLALTAGAVAVLCLHSAFAATLLLAATWGSWLHPEAAVATLAGVHAGHAILEWTGKGKDGRDRRVHAAHALVTGLVCGGLLAFRSDVAAVLGQATAAVVLQLHLIALVSAAALSLALSRPLLRVAGRLAPAQAMGTSHQPGPLNACDLEIPSRALGAALREVMRMADLIEGMLRSTTAVFLHGDHAVAQGIRDAELKVNAIYGSLKRYLAQVPRRPLSAAERERWEELLAFLLASEQVADRVVRVLGELEHRKAAPHRLYPAPAQREVLLLLGQLEANMRLAASVCLDRGVDAARALSASMEAFRNLEQSFRSAHVERLVAGDASSAAISALHFNLMADLLDMNDQICAFGRRVLALSAASGSITPSRLAQELPAAHSLAAMTHERRRYSP